MTPELHARARALFLRVADLDPVTAHDLIDREPHPGVQAEVRSLLGYVREAPLFEEAQPTPLPPATSTPKPDPLNVAGLIIKGRYRLDRCVAEGGFSWIYRGHEIAQGAPVALKVLKPPRPQVDRHAYEAAFLREGDLLSELAAYAPGVVKPLASGRTDNSAGPALCFLGMEWLEGQPLSKVNAAWSLRELLAALEPVAEAVAIAHERGIAHRDIKPSNIFLLDNGTCKLLDFGIAKVARNRIRFDSTTGHQLAVTMSYAAPEQLDRRLGASGPHTDVHALALVAVHRLLGRHPLAGLDPLDSAQALLNPGWRPTPRRCGLTVDAAVEAVFEQALAVTPKARLPNARALWTALTEAARARGWRRWLPR